MKEISDELYEKLDILGLLPNDVRSSNVGKSDYSQHFIQPWSIWLDRPDLTSWDDDIIKRVLRTKKGETRRSDYEKIIHNCQERIRQIDVMEKYGKKDALFELGEDGGYHRVPSRKPTGLLGKMLEGFKKK